MKQWRRGDLTGLIDTNRWMGDKTSAIEVL